MQDDGDTYWGLLNEAINPNTPTNKVIEMLETASPEVRKAGAIALVFRGDISAFTSLLLAAEAEKNPKTEEILLQSATALLHVFDRAAIPEGAMENLKKTIETVEAKHNIEEDYRVGANPETDADHRSESSHGTKRGGNAEPKLRVLSAEDLASLGHTDGELADAIETVIEKCNDDAQKAVAIILKKQILEAIDALELAQRARSKFLSAKDDEAVLPLYLEFKGGISAVREEELEFIGTEFCGMADEINDRAVSGERNQKRIAYDTALAVHDAAKKIPLAKEGILQNKGWILSACQTLANYKGPEPKINPPAGIAIGAAALGKMNQKV